MGDRLVSTMVDAGIWAAPLCGTAIMECEDEASRQEDVLGRDELGTLSFVTSLETLLARCDLIGWSTFSRTLLEDPGEVLPLCSCNLCSFLCFEDLLDFFDFE